MVEISAPDYDALNTRCPALGHLVFFAYCRKCTDDRPCRKIADCWFHEIDIQNYLKERYSLEEIAAILAPPQPKLLQILEMARKASSGKD